MERLDEISENVLIVAPTGQDGPLAQSVLDQFGFVSEVLPGLADLRRRLAYPAGVLFLAEEALEPDEAVARLKDTLVAQEAWSDIPILVMVSGENMHRSGRAILRQIGSIGNVSLIERPFHTDTLISTLRSLMRARRRQYQVKHLLAELQTALQQRDEFVSIASHELKTPLTSLKLQNQLSRKAISRGDFHILTPERIARNVETTDRQLDRLSKLIEDLLDVSRIRAGRLRVELADGVDLIVLVRQVSEQLAPQLLASGSALDFVEQGPILGSWDSHRVEQIITNILTNAIKYGAGKPIRISAIVEEDQALLMIKDQGVGISPDDQERVFQRFERVGADTSISGLGLGLYIVREIVEIHGGKIGVESELGRGSTFWVRLPLGKPAPLRLARHSLSR